MEPWNYRRLFLIASAVFLVNGAVAAQDIDPDEFPASPKEGWAEDFPDAIEREEGRSREWWIEAFLWFPNRILDFIDILRVDVGVGPSAGAVVRVTEWGQLGYRQMMPFSVRIGDMGRKLPVLIEKSNEFGIGPGFSESSQREICPGEVGAGVDVLIVGAYAGVCVDEAADFLAGLFFWDIQDDDL